MVQSGLQRVTADWKMFLMICRLMTVFWCWIVELADFCLYFFITFVYLEFFTEGRCCLVWRFLRVAVICTGTTGGVGR